MLNRLVTFTVAVLLLSLTLAMGSMWQIEEIWRSLQNGWVYGLPFGMSTTNYWFAHDIWFCLWGFSYALTVMLVLALMYHIITVKNEVK